MRQQPEHLRQTRGKIMHFKDGFPKRMTHPKRTAVVSAADELQEMQFAAQGFVVSPMQQFEEFPKVLNHPDARLVAPRVASDGFGVTEKPATWEPSSLAPVTVRNTIEENAYRKLGYEPAGKSDVAAFSHAQASPTDVRREVVQFPKWITPPEGEAVLVKSAAEEQASC